jgi:phosphate transport system permease protein
MLGYLFAVIVLASVLGYAINRTSARRLIRSGRRFHSLAGFHGAFAVCLSGLPALVFVMLWLVSQDRVIEAIVISGLPAESVAGLDAGALSLAKAEIRSIAAGNIFGTPEPWKLSAAESLNNLRGTAGVALFVAVLAPFPVMSRVVIVR